jgi:Uma2 family endonuclease
MRVITIDLDYPSSDGQPMAENTQQFNWITFVKTNLESHFAGNPEVFVAGDLLWYPVEGNPKITTAPDVMVVFGRPKGDRSSYIQYREDNTPPQVAFEIISNSNRRNPDEMVQKHHFYERYGIEEYYIIDPDSHELIAYLRQNENLELIPLQLPLRSPRLQITFDWSDEGLQLYYPDGLPFEHFDELKRRAATERQRAEVERQRAEAEKLRAEKLAQRLRQLGIDPDSL